METIHHFFKINCGVPPGSILGPILFSLYIHDIHKAIANSTVYHFADDTNLLYPNKDPNEIMKIMNYDLQSLYEWFYAMC